MKYYNLIIYHPISTQFDSFLYKTQNINVEVGDLVEVPFGKKKLNAIVFEEVKNINVNYEIKEIENISFKQAITKDQIDMCKWISSYFATDLYKTLKLFLPEYLYKKIKSKETFDIFIKNQLSKNIDKYTKNNTKKIFLTENQKKAIEKIKQNSPNQFLLYEKSNEQKTAIFIYLINETISQNKTAILILPDIILIKETYEIFKKFFDNNKIAIFHTDLKDNEKIKIWHEIRQKKINLIISTKTAIFLPIPDLDLVIIDEYHDQAYNNNQKPTYNIKQICAYLHAYKNITTIYSSYTPNVCDIHNHIIIQIEKETNKKPNKINIETINMKLNTSKTNISKKALIEIEKILEKGQKVFIYHNQRGIAKSLFCNNCHNVFKCPNCDVSLTYHNIKSKPYLICHQCNFIQKVPNECPICQSIDLKLFKYGIQFTEDILKKFFPNKNIIRIDKDNIKSYRLYEEIFNGIKQNKYDIIIGTNIITRSLSMKYIGLILIIDAEQLFNYPFFDVQEKSMQIVYQLINKSNESIFNPKIFIQTINPDSDYIKAILKQNYVLFLKKELERRKRFFYPPYSILIVIQNKDKSQEKCIQILKEIQSIIKDQKEIISIHLTPAIIQFQKNKYVWQLIIKASAYTNYMMKIFNQFKSIKLFIYE